MAVFFRANVAGIGYVTFWFGNEVRLCHLLYFLDSLARGSILLVKFCGIVFFGVVLS